MEYYYHCNYTSSGDYVDTASGPRDMMGPSILIPLISVLLAFYNNLCSVYDLNQSILYLIILVEQPRPAKFRDCLR